MLCDKKQVCPFHILFFYLSQIAKHPFFWKINPWCSLENIETYLSTLFFKCISIILKHISINLDEKNIPSSVW